MSDLQGSTQEVQEGAVVAKPVVRISDCKRMLKEGMSRKEIAAYYGYPMSAMAEKVWSNPELKGLKTKKIFNIEVIDDTKEVSEQAVQAEESVEAMVPAENAVETTSEVKTTTEANQAFEGNLQAEIGETKLAEAIPATNLRQ